MRSFTPFVFIVLLVPCACTGSGEAESSTTETTAQTQDPETGSETGEEACSVIELPSDSFFPESVAVDADGLLYVSSAAQGAILRAEPCGDQSYFVAAGGELRNAGGLHIDHEAGRLFVCDVDLAGVSAPEIDVYALDTGALISSHVFEPAVAFCNDLVLDTQGNVYATNSFGPEIVRVAAQDVGSDAPASTWASDPRLVAPEGMTGANGIAHDGEDSLYIGVFAAGSLHRITITNDGSAGAIEDVVLSAPLAAPDAVRWDEGGLLATEIATGTVSRISLTGLEGASSTVIEGVDSPSSLVRVGGGAWVVESQIDHLLGLDPDPPQLPFRLVWAPL